MAHHRLPSVHAAPAPTVARAVVLLICLASGAPLSGFFDTPAAPRTRDPVVARVYEHLGDGPLPIVMVVDAGQFPRAVWARVKDLVAFRLHRPGAEGMTTADAPTYLVRDSDLYLKAAAALRNRTTTHEYVWCLLAAVLAHESAHTAPGTERQALTAEATHLRRCLTAGHLHATDGWNGGAYLQAVEARLRNPREHD